MKRQKLLFHFFGIQQKPQNNSDSEADNVAAIGERRWSKQNETATCERLATLVLFGKKAIYSLCIIAGSIH